jgi:hypothetical protein
LQEQAADQPFYLSCRTVERELGIPFQEASTWLRGLCDDGVLELVEAHRGRRAARYRFVWLPPAAPGEVLL